MLLQPAVWVTMISLVVFCAECAIPPSVVATANVLSILHAPLAFVAVGILVRRPVTSSSVRNLAIRQISALVSSVVALLAQGPALATATLLTALGAGSPSHGILIVCVVSAHQLMCCCTCIRTSGSGDHAYHRPPAR